MCDLIRPIRPKWRKIPGLSVLRCFQSVPRTIPGRIDDVPKRQRRVKGTEAIKIMITIIITMEQMAGGQTGKVNCNM